MTQHGGIKGYWSREITEVANMDKCQLDDWLTLHCKTIVLSVTRETKLIRTNSGLTCTSQYKVID